MKKMLKSFEFMKMENAHIVESKLKVLAESVSPLLGSLVSVLAREGGLWRLYDREYDAISPHLLAAKCQKVICFNFRPEFRILPKIQGDFF